MLSNVENRSLAQFGPGAEDIRGKTVVVIGDAGGFGLEAAMQLAAHGACVFLGAHNTAQLGAALAAIGQAGGQAKGMVVDPHHPESLRRLFALADRSGPVRGVVSCLASDPDWSECQNACTQEAITHLQGRARAQIVQVGPIKYAEDMARGLASALRRQASELGIRTTLIEPGEGSLDARDAARCVLDSLIQPFSMDVIFLPARPDENFM